MDFSQTLKRKALDRGMMFVGKKPATSDPIPADHCGFRKSFVPLQNLHCQIETDICALVSLALLNQRSPILEAYSNKLFIMTINVSRLIYTLEAFTLRNKTTDSEPMQQALEFYIKTDLKHIPKELPPNQQISHFLHRLKLSGYSEYIFALANEIDLNIDYIFDAKIAARYIRTTETAEKPCSTAIGVLTAIHEPHNEWYVKTTRAPILG